jgi:hypothetical protein
VHEGTPGGEHREVGVQVGEPRTATLDASRKKKSPGERKAAARMSERRWSASTSACTAASPGVEVARAYLVEGAAQEGFGR